MFGTVFCRVRGMVDTAAKGKFHPHTDRWFPLEPQDAKKVFDAAKAEGLSDEAAERVLEVAVSAAHSAFSEGARQAQYEF